MVHDPRRDQRHRGHDGPRTFEQADGRSRGKKEILTEIPVLYRDERLFVVHKPSGIHVHPSELDKGETTLLDLLRQTHRLSLFPVHRLDRPTSGVLVFTLDAQAASVLGEDFRHHRVEKSYWAVVRGWVEEERLIEEPVREGPGGPLREARSLVIPQKRFEAPFAWGTFPTIRASLVEIRPQTGRRHQIRQHLRKISHPILGDTSWGDLKQNRFWSERLGLDRLQLFCVEMSFRHPGTGCVITLRSEPREQERSFLRTLAGFELN